MRKELNQSKVKILLDKALDDAVGNGQLTQSEANAARQQ